MSTAIVWFRRDLRLSDNPALAAACAAHTRVLPVYIHAPGEEHPWPPGAASRWWLHHSLSALQQRLSELGSGLHLRQGDSLAELIALVRLSGADAVYWNRLYEPALVARDKGIKSALRQHGIRVESFAGSLWFEPWQIANQQQEPYRVFTPFWRNLRARLPIPRPAPEPALANGIDVAGSLPLAALGLLPRIGWDAGLRQTWRPGERGAREALEIFADDALGSYAQGRDIPSRHGTSRLSPHLHFGEITPAQIQARLPRNVDVEPYLRELGWREFAHHLLYHFPATTTKNFNPRFDARRWQRRNKTQLERWQRGRTGIPLVDAGMRELWHTGWMHNRVRMIVASWLTKNLRQHWRHGARWFWDTLVDADLANNTLGWQWVAGCGADAAPYHRIFNPVTQARKFDPNGDYLRRWLPELAGLPLDALHEPWKYPAQLAATGYPPPLVDLAESRRRALE